MDYLVNLNLNKNELQNAVIQPLAANPSSPKAGQVYFHSTNKKIYVYDGTNWVPVGTDQVQADWSQSNSTAVDYIKNKPSIPTSPSDINAQPQIIVVQDGEESKDVSSVWELTADGYGLYILEANIGDPILVSVPTVAGANHMLEGYIPKSLGTTAGDIMYFSAASTPARLGIGTAGQVLTVNSGATAPQWTSASLTDTHVNVTARGTTKAYLLGTTTSPTSSAQAVESVAETGVYFDTTTATLVATTFKGALTGTASGNLTSNSTLNAAKLSGAIPSAVTATTQTTGDDSTKIATTAFVNASIASAQVGAAMFQGDAPTTFAPTNYKKGYYWIVKTAGTYVGQTCEVGDMIFAIADYNSAYSASDFTVVQYNITDGSTSKKGIVQLYDGVDSTSTSLAATANAVKTAYDLANSYKGTVTSVGISNSGLITISGSPITSSGSITIGHGTPSGASAIDTAGFYKIKTDTYGHVNGVTAVAKSDITGLVGNATQSADGLMSAADKTTLDNLEAASQGAITYTSLTIAQGQTSVSASGVASKLITFQAYQGGEAVIVDYDGSNFSIASAAASAVTIKCVVTV